MKTFTQLLEANWTDQEGRLFDSNVKALLDTAKKISSSHLDQEHLDSMKSGLDRKELKELTDQIMETTKFLKDIIN